MYLVILLFALFASLFTLSKDTLTCCEPFFLIGSRMLLAGILLIGYERLIAKRSILIKSEHIAPLFSLGLFNIYLTNIAEIWGLSNMQSSKTCLLYSLSPFLAAFVAFLVLGERLNYRKWMGMILGFAGLIPIVYTQTYEEQLAGQFFYFTYAELSVITAVISSVYGWILLKKIVSEYDYSPMYANGFSMFIGGILALIHSYYSGESWTPFPITNSAHFIRNTLIMLTISNLICYNLYGYLLKKYSATFMSFAGLVTPLFASTFGWLFLDEMITWQYFVAIIFFSIGLTIFYQEEIQRNSTHGVGKKEAIGT